MLAIIVAMELVGFMPGLALGVALAAAAYVAQSASASAVVDSFPAVECRSRVMRPARDRLAVARELEHVHEQPRAAEPFARVALAQRR